MVMQPFCHRCQEQHFINGVCAYCDSSEFVSHPPPIAFKPGQSAAARSLGAQVNIACTLEGGGGGNNKQAIAQPVATVMQVRRLTPVECERLQGFPDNYTNIPWRKKPEAPDGPRYKSLGNSMAVPCMAWIGKRIAEVDRGD
jgi:DNA (cytosine-5)-methyltransferase 1